MLFDTSAYSAMHKGNEHLRQIIKDTNTLVLPAIVVGELRYGFINGSKPEQNELMLQKILATSGVKIADITMETTSHYAELYKYARMNGKVLSSNDLWIAALAKQLNERLVTLDKDFEILGDLLPAGLVVVEP